MARKSVDFTLSLERFQSQRKEPQNRRFRPESGGATSDISSTTTSSLSSQNHQLARTNAAMAVRIHQLEFSVTELTSENTRLRATATSASAGTSTVSLGLLEKRIKGIESTLVTQFDEVFQTIKQLRRDYNLADNSMLDALTPFSRPLTSTPLSQELALNVLIPSFGDPAAIVAPAPVRATVDPMEYFEKEESPVSVADMSFAENDEPSVSNYACSPILEESTEITKYDANFQPPIGEIDEVPLLRPSSATAQTVSADPQKDTPSDATVSEESSLSLRRSRRARKPVDYTLPSVHRKLRRESESLSPAVGDSDGDYFVKKSVVVYSNPAEEPAPSKESREEPRKRAALKNVTNESNNKRRRKLRDDEVFDIPKGSLALHKRKNGVESKGDSTGIALN